VRLKAGDYQAYCPIGGDSHRMLEMHARLEVTGRAGRAARQIPEDEHAEHEAGESEHEMHAAEEEGEPGPRQIHVLGGGPVIQILPGRFPFADSAAGVIRSRPADQRDDLMAKAKLGPYSNNVAKITGRIELTAVDRGAARDSVQGVAEFQDRDGTS